MNSYYNKNSILYRIVSIRIVCKISIKFNRNLLN